MNETVIDRETFARVLAAEPRIPFLPNELAQDVVRALRKMTDDECATKIKGVPFWETSVSDLAEALGEEITAVMVGRVVRKLGLRSERYRDGYHLFWNEEQLDILAEALGVG